MKNLDLSSKAAQVGCPTLVLCGEKDSANRKSAHLLAQTIKNAELKIVANTGHVVNEENPKALAEILNEYYLKPVIAPAKIPAFAAYKEKGGMAKKAMPPCGV